MVNLTYSLSMQLGRTSISIMEIAISSGVIDAIQLSLPHEQISLAQGPRLSHCQSFEVVSNFQEFIVNFLEFRINLAFPGIVLADDLPV